MQSSAFFPDRRLARPLEKGTVARGMAQYEGPPVLARKSSTAQALQAAGVVGSLTGGLLASMAAAGSYAPYTDTFPEPITRQLLARGQERYNIFCSVCHDRAGTGMGMIWRRGYAKPPSFHIPRLRNAPAGYFFEVATNGFGAMPEYGSQIPPRDRWAIIAYIRALQLSQNATRADVPSGVTIAAGDNQ